MRFRVTVEFFVDLPAAPPEKDLREQVDAWIAHCRDYDGQARRNVEQQAR
ncbi:MAG: hypothetical protein RLY20_2251, partial [Verrucomicrobiota bacterium]